MSVFGYEKFLRKVSHNGQEIILFRPSSSNENLISVAPSGTLDRAKVKRIAIWAFQNLSYILAVNIVVAAIILGVVSSNYWFLAIFFGIALAAMDWACRSDYGNSISEMFFGERKEEYFKATARIPAIDKQRNLIENHMMNASDEEFVNIAEKFVEREKIRNAMNELESNINSSRHDSEIFEFAQEKLKDLRAKRSIAEDEFGAFMSSLRIESEDRELFESVIKAEKLLVG